MPIDNNHNYFLIVVGIFSVQCAFSLIFSFWASYKIAQSEEKIKENKRDIDNLGSKLRLSQSRNERNLNTFMDECSKKFRNLGTDSKFTHLD